MIIAGSESDKDIIRSIEEDMNKLNIQYTTEYASLHREPNKVIELLKKNNAEIYVGVAGLAAMLPGFIASQKKNNPVIGVPVHGRNDSESLAATLSIFEMPKGIPLLYVNPRNVASTIKMLLEWKKVK